MATPKLSNDVKAIELWPCGYDALCKVRNCKARATTIARSVDAGDRPIKQYELLRTAYRVSGRAGAG